MAIMMAGGKEGNWDGDNGVRQGTVMATKRTIVTATMVAGKGSKGGWWWARAARAARAKAMKRRVAGREKGDSKGGKGDDNGNKVASNEEGDCKGGKGNSNSNHDGGQQRGQWQGGQRQWRRQ